MAKLGDHISESCLKHIQTVLGDTRAFPVGTSVVETDKVDAPQTKKLGNKTEIHVPQGWLQANDEVRDTLIFEGINVINKPRLDRAETSFAGNSQTLSEYGRAYADIEAETTWYAGQVFQEMTSPDSDVTVSRWGCGVRDAVAASTDLDAFKVKFATTPQDPNAEDQRQLPSQELYQFEWVSRKASSLISRKLRVGWLGDQVNKLSNAGANSARDRFAKHVEQLTDMMSHLNAGSKGRVERYNEILKTLSKDSKINAAFLNTPPYRCPSY